MYYGLQLKLALKDFTRAIHLRPDIHHYYMFRVGTFCLPLQRSMYSVSVHPTVCVLTVCLSIQLSAHVLLCQQVIHMCPFGHVS